ncbi:MAG: GAF domain-containing sensor histidine kinase [Bacillota bacterium]
MDTINVLNRREKYSKILLLAVSLVGWGILLGLLTDMYLPHEPMILLLLAFFLFLSEYFPMPVWRGFTSISFPLLYVLYILYGISYSLVIFAMAVLVVNLIQRRPIRIVFFNPAQLIVSFFMAHAFFFYMSPIVKSFADSDIMFGLVEYSTLLALFLFFNNLIVDMVLFIRPQPYPFHVWLQKTITEGLSGLVSLLYGFLLYFIGKDRGEIDTFSYFFFFSPLVGLALLSSVIVRLRKERKRLKALFTITNELNQMLPTQKWLGKLKESFQDFMNVEALLLWVKEGGDWQLAIKDGRIRQDAETTSQILSAFDEVKSPLIYDNRKKGFGIAGSLFEKDIKSAVYSPLVIDNETVGMFFAGRSRTRSFEDDDIRSIATLSNQLAVILKTKMLFTEKEKRIVLEERNRIAREIHDGLAQTLAGAVMKLDTAGKKIAKQPEVTSRLVEESISGLRESLKEVRASIYALRPYPTERTGLKNAIANKIESVRKEHGKYIHLEVRGHEEDLSPMAEKVLFDTFKESIQNAIKHSNAEKLEVLLSYQSEQILLKIKDNGIGFSLFQAILKARTQPHFGILQMNDAADTINASLQIDSHEGVGTEVTIIVPKMGFEGGNEIDQANAGG